MEPEATGKNLADRAAINYKSKIKLKNEAIVIHKRAMEDQTENVEPSKVQVELETISSKEPGAERKFSRSSRNSLQ